MDGCESKFRGRDRQNARAAADVEEAASVDLEQQLEDKPGGLVRPGAEGAPGVDHDRRQSGLRLVPRRANPERPHDHRDVEAPPLVLPTGEYWIDLDLIEASAELGKPCVVRVDDDGILFLEETGRRELEQLRDDLLEPTRWDGDPRAQELAQRNALFNFSKNPSSGR